MLFPLTESKTNPTQNNLEKLVITINDNKKTFSAHKELASNDKETFMTDEKTVN